jgi:hypothetical protein
MHRHNNTGKLWFLLGPPKSYTGEAGNGDKKGPRVEAG